MDKQEYVSFLKNVHPFDELDDVTLEGVVEHLDIFYFDLEQTVLQKGDNQEYLYIILKGSVYEKNSNDEIVDTYTTHDTFSAISIIENRVKNSFIVSQEVICYGLKKEKFLELFYNNEEFESYYFQNISAKLNKLMEKKHNQRLSNFMVSKVKDIFIHKPTFVEHSESIYNTVLKMKEKHLASILVKRGDEVGIVTDSNIKNGVVLKGHGVNSAIEPLTIFNLITIDEEEFLFNALLIMIEKDIKRLVVKRGESEVVGVLEQIDLISYFSNHTQIIISQIQKSNSFEELKDASESVTNIIKSLEAKGVKIRYIAKLLSQIHTKIFHKLYTMIFDEEFIKNSALIVMGSEGRSEQILRTDQDMGIIIRDDFDYSGYKDKFVEYTKYLIDFGFPECDGNIMTSNDFWSKNVDEYKKSIYNWIYQPSEQGFMEIAIFADARCVCGDEELLTDVKSYFFEIIKSNQKFLIAFANSALMFETPLNIFTNFVVDDKKRLDIKKGGIFAIVQGVRALALEHNIETTNTVERLKELNNSGILDREFTTELIESYELLLKLRLKHRLLAIDKGLEVNNGITPSDMSKLEQDLLKDSFRAVDKLKKLLTHHFRLNYV